MAVYLKVGIIINCITGKWWLGSRKAIEEWEWMQQGMSDAAGMLGEGAQPNLRARIVVSPTSTLYSRSTAHLKRDESSFNLISLELKQTVSSYRNWNMYLVGTDTNCVLVSYRNWNMYLGGTETNCVSYRNWNMYLVGTETNCVIL